MEQPTTTATEATADLSLGPRAVERPADSGWTLVGGIDEAAPARVDGGGLVAPAGADWLVDWWVGGDDRWYLPAREPSIRQRRIGLGPVIETSMRVPSGDVVATAYPVLAAGRRATVIEITNVSPVPVALAIAVRPIPIGGGDPTPIRLDLIDRTIVTVDGAPALLLPRPANQAGAHPERDLLDVVLAGEALEWDGPVTGPRANAVCLYPLPHTTSLRFTVVSAGPATDSALGAPAPDALRPEALRLDALRLDALRPDVLPPPDNVARGWTSVVERPATWRFPDPGITALAGAARSRLLLAAPGLADRFENLEASDTNPSQAAAVLEALALGGHADECRPSLEALAAGFPTRLPPDGAGPAVVRAAATAAELFGAETADGLLGAMTQLTALIGRGGDRLSAAQTELALARLAARAGQADAARHLRSRSAPASSPGGESSTGHGDAIGNDSSTGLDRVTELAQRATPAGSWPPDDDVALAARFWMMANALLLERQDPEPDRAGQTGRSAQADLTVVRLLPTMPSAWMGGEVEVHRAPLAGHRISFAIRWHGYRPALLWEVEPIAPGSSEPTGLRLTCPGLDPGWSTVQPSGEALLAGAADELPPAPGPGESFS